MNFSNSHRLHQRGAILAGSLIFLLVLSVLGAATLSATSSGERVVKGMQDAELAVQAADSVTKDVEAVIETKLSSIGLSGLPGWYEQGTAPDPHNSSTWTTSASNILVTNYTKKPLRYFIEILGDFAAGGSTNITITGYGGSQIVSTNVTIFRIVTYSTGSTGHAKTIIETYYGKVF